MRGKAAPECPSVYEARPPTWLPKSHTSADLGYIGFDPPRPGQEEELLLRQHVKDGYIAKHAVPAEGFSAQEVVNEALNKDGTLAGLEDLMNMVLTRRANEAPTIQGSTFRLPSRVTLNDAKRQAWFKDLADPDVPLYKLGKNVPHGIRGHELLDVLHAHNVAVPRAVWFLRVFGANETAGLRKQASYNPTQYSVDWANVMTSYLKKQINDIALPTAPRLGFSVKQTFKGVLNEPESRQRWTNRFTYCVNLLRNFYDEGMLDHRTFLAWLVQQLAACNLAQAGFLVRLADEYLEDIARSRGLCHPCVEASLSKLTEVRGSDLPELSFLDDMLVGLLRRALLLQGDAFVSPRLWTLYHGLLEGIFLGDEDRKEIESSEPGLYDLHTEMLSRLEEVEQRVANLLFLDEPVRERTDFASAVLAAQHLNSFDPSTDVSALALTVFGDKCDNPDTFARKLDIVLSWSVCPSQYGEHRPYVVVALLDRWRIAAEARATRKDTVPPYEFLHDQLFDWLDQCDLSADEACISVVADLFGKLAKEELFLYPAYVQRLIARGEPGLSLSSDGPASRHRELLRSIPVCSTSPSSLLQRKVVLYGPRARDSPEDAVEKELRRELRTVLPEMWDGEATATWSSMSALWDACPTFQSAKCYEQTRTVGQWLIPTLCKRLADSDRSPVDARTCVVCICIAELSHCHDFILEVCVYMLRHSEMIESVTIALETLRRLMVIWTCLSSWNKVVIAVLDAQHRWRARGIQMRALLRFLKELDELGLLPAVDQEHLASDAAGLRQALAPTVDVAIVIPSVLPEILLLAQDPNQNSPSLLANALWYKYRTSANWAWKVWDNTIASLRQLPVMAADPSDRLTCARRYVAFLAHVDMHLVDGFNAQVLDWFVGPGKNEVAALNEEVWELVVLLVVKLCATGVLAISTVLRGLVYPTWRAATLASSEAQASSIVVVLRSVTSVFKALLSDEYEHDTASTTTVELYRLRCHRAEVFRAPYFVELLCETYSLVIIEGSPLFSDDVQQASGRLWRATYGSAQFQQALYRDFDGIREVLKRSTAQSAAQGAGDAMDVDVGLVPLVFEAALQTCINSSILRDAGEDDTSSKPWMLAIRGLAMQLAIAQASRSIPNGNAVPKDLLDTLLSKLVHPRITAEEVAFVIDLAKNVDGVVAKKFLDLGFSCISDLLSEGLKDGSQLRLEDLRTPGEILHLLAAVIQPIRENGQTLPEVDPVVQERFIDAWRSAFDKASSNLLSQTSTGGEPMDVLIFLIRLLQFNLGVPGAWTEQLRTQGPTLNARVFEMMIHHGAGLYDSPVAFAMLVDTLYYLIDELNAHTTSSDLFQYYPQLPNSELPSDMPLSHREKLRTLLPFTPVNHTTTTLAYATRDPSGILVTTHPVQNRPWEWMEYLGEPPGGQAEADRPQDEHTHPPGRRAIRNAGAISLDLFDAQMTGDGVPDTSLDARARAALHTFEDGLAGDSLFQRAWRESRLEPPDVPVTAARTRNEDMDTLSALPNFPRAPGSRPTSRGPSPTSSVFSRAPSWQYGALGYAMPSAPPSGAGSLRGSPAGPFAHATASRASVSTSASGEGEVGELPQVAVQNARRASKRKAHAPIEDDDVQIIDPPAGAKKSTKGRTAAKTKGKR